MIARKEFDNLFYAIYSHDEEGNATLTGETISLSDFLKQNPNYYSKSTYDENRNPLVELKSKRKKISIRIPADLFE